LKKIIIRVISLLKGFFFLLKPGSYLGFISSPLIFVGNSLKLSRWISHQRRNKLQFDDYFKLIRNYKERFKLHEFVMKSENLKTTQIDYLEFGVAEGISFDWWLKENQNSKSRFFGFDTFEGLPQNWGIFKKGEMAPNELRFQDDRYKFIKGLFQLSLPRFLNTTKFNSTVKKVVHLDADLFSSTLFVLASIYPTLKPDDILIFDEFCVPNHEYFAFRIFEESFNVKLEPIAAFNNYLQVAFKIKKENVD
jgi:O-methyltransferase